MRGTAFRTMVCLAGALAASPLALPTAARADAGDEARAVEKEYGVIGRQSPEGEQLNDQLERVTTRITSAAGYTLRSAKLLGGRNRTHDRVVNAFALPDGHIYVTLGLMRAIQQDPDPDGELAFVVGHEVTHVVKKHGEAQHKTAMGAGIAAMVIGIATRNPAAGDLAGVGAQAYVSHFSREDEYEADRGGLFAMHKAGYSLDAAPAMLKRLQSVPGAQQDRSLNGWFGTHPLTQSRVNKIGALIARIRKEDEPGEGR